MNKMNKATRKTCWSIACPCGMHEMCSGTPNYCYCIND